jgi:hypothetical protein
MDKSSKLSTKTILYSGLNRDWREWHKKVKAASGQDEGPIQSPSRRPVCTSMPHHPGYDVPRLFGKIPHP